MKIQPQINHANDSRERQIITATLQFHKMLRPREVDEFSNLKNYYVPEQPAVMGLPSNNEHLAYEFEPPLEINEWTFVHNPPTREQYLEQLNKNRLLNTQLTINS
ncbi:MAG: hypothetical protein SFU25_05555 [Candidatus Caenarcaniphilales bacterium]|nr:hypothetical protein [Candidatus Caenarcaniphilales bacterium]